MKQMPLKPWRWGRLKYERLVDLGAFENDPIELIGGQLMVAEPKGSEHATAIGVAHDALRAALPAGWIVREQTPSRSTTSPSRSPTSPSSTALAPTIVARILRAPR